MPPDETRRTIRVPAEQILERRRHMIPEPPRPRSQVEDFRALIRAAQYPDRRNDKALELAVSAARENGMAWEEIATILRIDNVQHFVERFSYIDDKLILQGTPPPEHKPAPVRPEVDYKAIAKLPTEELEEMARSMSGKVGLRARWDQATREALALREAVVVALYNREYHHGRIAALLGLSGQRIQQIVAEFYDRMEKVWEAERQERMGR